MSKCLANRLNKALHKIIHKDQSYCIKDRCIADNLHLVRNVIDYAMCNNINVGILSLDQEKALDRVDHQYLFSVMEAFGFGEKCINMIKLLYNNATCMIKVAGGLSVPVKVQRGIRQGCPISYKRQYWVGLVEKVCARFSKWKWLLPQLSYRGRVLVCNNLVASTLWHKMNVLEPPEELVKNIQKQLIGQHWIKAPTLFLPRSEGVQGLVDIKTRIMAFRFQTAKRLLYGVDVSWSEVACALLRRAGGMGLDRHLFLMDT